METEHLLTDIFQGEYSDKLRQKENVCLGFHSPPK